MKRYTPLFTDLAAPVIVFLLALALLVFGLLSQAGDGPTQEAATLATAAPSATQAGAPPRPATATWPATPNTPTQEAATVIAPRVADGDFRPSFVLNVRSCAAFTCARIGQVTSADWLPVDLDSLTVEDEDGYRWIWLDSREAWVAVSFQGTAYGELYRWLPQGVEGVGLR